MTTCTASRILFTAIAMLLSPLTRQIFLPLAFPVAGALIVSTFAITGRATNPLLEQWR